MVEIPIASWVLFYVITAPRKYEAVSLQNKTYPLIDDVLERHGITDTTDRGIASAILSIVESWVSSDLDASIDFSKEQEVLDVVRLASQIHPEIGNIDVDLNRRRVVVQGANLDDSPYNGEYEKWRNCLCSGNKK